MSHTIKHPDFQHRHNAETLAGIPGLDQSISLLKIQTLLAVMRDYFNSDIVQDGSRKHLLILADMISSEADDCQARIDFQKKQNQQLFN